MSDLVDHRGDLAGIDAAAGRSNAPQMQHLPPSAAPASAAQGVPWKASGTGRPTALAMPANVFQGSFYHDDSDPQSPSSQLSPVFRVATGRTGSAESPDVGYFGLQDERRPSVVSTTTTGSTGSRGSANKAAFHKKLQGFFGDDFGGRDGSDSSLPPGIGKEQRSQQQQQQQPQYARPSRARKASVASAHSARDTSPTTSRPRTPVPSSDVVPFLYQEAEVRGDSTTSCVLGAGRDGGGGIAFVWAGSLLRRRHAGLRAAGPPTPWALYHVDES